MSAEENKAVVQRLVEEAMDGSNISLIDELVAPDFITHSVPPGFPPNRDTLKESLQWTITGLPDARVTVEDMIAEGDRVAVRILMRGTHRGLLYGVRPTGKLVSVGATHIFRFARGKIVEHWSNSDDLGLIQQLGDDSGVGWD